jgi:hypothetical protein
MSRHCRECGKLMQLRHSTFAKPGGYKCINRNCPNSELFHYRNPRGKVFAAAYRAAKVKQGCQTMINHRHCPECDSQSTRQHTEFHRDMIEVVRTCDECPTQWVASYGNPVVREVQTFD